MATDIAIQDEEARDTYASLYKDMNDTIMTYMKTYTNCDECDILSVTAMMIGAVAISRTLKEEKIVQQLLKSCRRDAGRMLGGI